MSSLANRASLLSLAVGFGLVVAASTGAVWVLDAAWSAWAVLILGLGLITLIDRWLFGVVSFARLIAMFIGAFALLAIDLLALQPTIVWTGQSFGGLRFDALEYAPAAAFALVMLVLSFSLIRFREHRTWRTFALGAFGVVYSSVALGLACWAMTASESTYTPDWLFGSFIAPFVLMPCVASVGAAVALWISGRLLSNKRIQLTARGARLAEGAEAAADAQTRWAERWGRVVRVAWRETELARRRRIGLAIGAVLAFAFGGWPGLSVALLVVAVVRALGARSRERSRMQ